SRCTTLPTTSVSPSGRARRRIHLRALSLTALTARRSTRQGRDLPLRARSRPWSRLMRTSLPSPTQSPVMTASRPHQLLSQTIPLVAATGSTRTPAHRLHRTIELRRSQELPTSGTQGVDSCAPERRAENELRSGTCEDQSSSA